MRVHTAISAIVLAALVPASGYGEDAGFAAAAAAAAESVPAETRAAITSKLLSLEPAALAELFPLAMEAYAIHTRAGKREAKHLEELKARGIAEVPPCGGKRYTIDTGGLFNGLSFNEWGEFYVDRRFITKSEMKTVRAVEAWIRKWFPKETKKRFSGRKKRGAKQGGGELPVFSGFEDDRYQAHDALIVKLVDEFNADKATGCGGTAAQAEKIQPLSAALVKSHMIEESGGNGPRSIAAWKADPLQVNVPGDWGDEKKLVGLSKPERRNEGSLETNVRAAIRYLSRKGFSTAARPAADRPNNRFSGWPAALRRYNGRRDRTDTDRYYSDEYADKIVKRANHPGLFVPIEIKLAAKRVAKKDAKKDAAEDAKKKDAAKDGE